MAPYGIFRNFDFSTKIVTSPCQKFLNTRIFQTFEGNPLQCFSNFTGGINLGPRFAACSFLFFHLLTVMMYSRRIDVFDISGKWISTTLKWCKNYTCCFVETKSLNWLVKVIRNFSMSIVLCKTGYLFPGIKIN